jgi:cytochrome c peroxidase
VNVLEKGSQVHDTAESQELLDFFPPAPKLDLFGRLDPAQGTAEELRGQALFFGKARCNECHQAPSYTDNTMHDLRTERFFTPKEIRSRLAMADGSMKTFPLRGIKDSPPYMHDDRLLTLDDRRVLQSRARYGPEREGEERPGRLPPRALTRQSTIHGDSMNIDIGIDAKMRSRACRKAEAMIRGLVEGHEPSCQTAHA